MNPIELLLSGHKKAAKKAAKGLHIVDLSSMAKEYGFPSGDRWTIAAYLLGWARYREVEEILNNKK